MYFAENDITLKVKCKQFQHLFVLHVSVFPFLLRHKMNSAMWILIADHNVMSPMRM